MDFDKVVEKRHSVRKFAKKKPSWKDIAEAINAARLAPLAGNIPSLKFLVVTEKEEIRKIADAANQDWIKFTDIVVAVCSDDKNLVLSYGERGKKYAKQQAGAAIENFILKLEDLGLSTCWVGAFYDEEMKKVLKVPHDIDIEAVLPIGYEDKKEKAKKRPKPDLSEIVFWEKWGNFYKIPPKKLEI